MCHRFIFAFIFLFQASSLCFAADNQLSEQEKAAGWQLLFNGKDMSHWRNFKKPSLDPKWQIDNNSMYLSAKGGGDLLSKQKFNNFELTLDWKISEAGNSGVFIMADELGANIYSHAVEVQILDNDKHYDNKVASHLSGSVYDLIPSSQTSHRPAGQWNTLYIQLNNKELTVKQNGIQITKILIGSEQWHLLVAKSKFKTWLGFAKNAAGHIGLQDHGDPVWFKNIKIRQL